MGVGRAVVRLQAREGRCWQRLRLREIFEVGEFFAVVGHQATVMAVEAGLRG